MLVTHDYQQLQKQVGVFFNLFGSDPSFDLTVSSVRGWSKKSQQFAESPKFFFLMIHYKTYYCPGIFLSMTFPKCFFSKSDLRFSVNRSPIVSH